MTHYANGPEGMPKVERMSDSTIDWATQRVSLDHISIHDETGHRQLREYAHAIAEEVLARLPNWPVLVQGTPVGAGDGCGTVIVPGVPVVKTGRTSSAVPQKGKGPKDGAA